MILFVFFFVSCIINMFLLINSIALTMADLHCICSVCFLWVLRPFYHCDDDDCALLWWRGREWRMQKKPCAHLFFLSTIHPLGCSSSEMQHGLWCCLSFILRKHRFQDFQIVRIKHLWCRCLWKTEIELFACWIVDILIDCLAVELLAPMINVQR